MVLIWGSKGKAKEIGAGIFYCPNCTSSQNYKHYELGKYFTLYFIPLFQTSKITEYIDCQRCKTSFKTEVLNYNLGAQQRIREMLGGIKRELDNGVSANILYQFLLTKGLSQGEAENLISMAAGGSFSTCDNCKQVYSAHMNFCSNCGSALSASI